MFTQAFERHSRPHRGRIVTIEDAAELQLRQPHVVRLETRPPNLEGKGQVTIHDLLVNSLRMRPDRIVVGECRAAETLDMLQAMNTGHEGSMTTVHANTTRDAVQRIETMVMMSGVELPQKAIRQQFASAIDLILQIALVKKEPDGPRPSKKSGLNPLTFPSSTSGRHDRSSGKSNIAASRVSAEK